MGQWRGGGVLVKPVTDVFVFRYKTCKFLVAGEIRLLT